MHDRKILSLLILCFLVCSCGGHKIVVESNPDLNVKRFDVDFHKYLNKQVSEESLSAQYKPFLDVFGTQVINIGTPDSTGFYEKLNSFFSDKDLMSLYKDQQEKFVDFEFVDKELNPALVTLLSAFPSLKQPSVYVHVSGLNQSVIVTDEVLSLSADKYLGADYPFYGNFFYDYQLSNMTPERIVPDYLLGFMMANFQSEGAQGVLLDNILYEGKLRYILSRLLPDRKQWEYVAYTKEQYAWCDKNEAKIWKAILENDHLYSSDYMRITQYTNDAPYTAAVSAQSPGRVGIWVGFRIISSYMKKHPETTLADLMKLTDAGELLKEAKYKP